MVYRDPVVLNGCLPESVIKTFGFEYCVKRFHRRIVPALSACRAALYHSFLMKQETVIQRKIGAPLVTVNNCPADISCPGKLLDAVHAQLLVRMKACLPCHDLTVIQVFHGRKVLCYPDSLQVGDVTYILLPGF